MGRCKESLREEVTRAFKGSGSLDPLLHETSCLYVRPIFTDHPTQIVPTAPVAGIRVDRAQLVIKRRNPGGKDRQKEVTKTVVVRRADERTINRQ